jgi:pimeloyl-ACP methyl ester carboxylesterase
LPLSLREDTVRAIYDRLQDTCECWELGPGTTIAEDMITYILLHGTFEKRADWPELVNVLTDIARIKRHQPKFKEITWSGNNLIADRVSASKKIASSVEEILTKVPREKIFVIGHSHGGSAIAYFLKEFPNLANRVAGCVFLSTPFVAIRPRAHLRTVLALCLILPISLVDILTLLFLNYAKGGKFISDTFASRSIVVMNVLCISAMLLGTFLIRQKLELTKGLEEGVKRQTVDIAGRRLLFLRFAGDEAAASLAFAQFISWLSIKASRSLNAVAQLFEAPLAAYFVLPALLTLLAVAIQLVQVDYAASTRNYSLFFSALKRGDLLPALIICIGLIAEYVLLPLFALVTGIFLISIVLPTLAAWSFGWLSLFRSFMFEFSVEPLPFGEHVLINLDWTWNVPTSRRSQLPLWLRFYRLPGEFSTEMMQHSWTHSHPVAIERIGEWIGEGLEGADADVDGERAQVSVPGPSAE